MSQETESSRGIRDRLVGEVIAEGRAAQTASDVLDEAAVGVMGINRTDGRCLEIMERSGGLTAGRLASESGLTTGAVTAVLDRLEQAGYVRRVRDEQDRRRVLVELTPEGHALGGEIYRPLADMARAVLETYTEDHLIAIRDYLRAVRELNSEMARRLQGSSWLGDLEGLKGELRSIKRELKELVRREFTEPARQAKRELKEPLLRAKQELKAQADAVKRDAKARKREAKGALRPRRSGDS